MFSNEPSPGELVHPRSLSASATLRTLAALVTATAVACGGKSTAPSTGTDQPPPVDSPPPADNPPPSASAPAITGISSGAVLAGPVGLAASAPAGTATVQYQLDGAVVAS